MLNRISIDGFFASADRASWGMDWFIQDPEVEKAAHKIGDSTDTLLLGGLTYRGFENSWVPMLNDPDTAEDLKSIAEELTKLNKVVFSKTLKQSEITWKNTTLFDGNLEEEVTKIKQKIGGNILILGSGTIVQQLANANLIDEYIFIVTPVISGSGKLLFDKVKKSNLTLLGSETFKSDNVVLHYGVNN